MKLSDRRLKRLMRVHRIPVWPKKKEDFLHRIAEYTETMNTPRDKEEKHMMHWRRIRPAVVMLAVLLSLTTVISAALAAGYYFAAPDGSMFDEDGNSVDMTEEVDLVLIDHPLVGNGYSITAITWTEVNNLTTLTVWINSAGLSMDGLTAVIDESEYVLTAAQYNLGSGLVGYTATDIPQPETFILKCDEPMFNEEISLHPDQLISSAAADQGISIYGRADGNKVYYGLNDSNIMKTDLYRYAEGVSGTFWTHAVTDSNGSTTAFPKNLDLGTNWDILTRRCEYPDIEQISSIQCRSILLQYFFDDAFHSGQMPVISIPVPEDEGIIEGEWKLLDSAGIDFTINRIRREGDTLSYESDNGAVIDPSVFHGLRSISIQTSCLEDSSVYGNNGKMTFAENSLDVLHNLQLGITSIYFSYEGNWELNF